MDASAPESEPEPVPKLEPEPEPERVVGKDKGKGKTKAKAKAKAKASVKAEAKVKVKVKAKGRKPRLGRKKAGLVSAIDKPLLHPEKDWYCYLLTTPASAVPYIGKTCDLTRRLREHNGELVGGAKRTHRVLEGGATWTRQLHLRGFPDERAALNFEWRFTYDCRRNAGADRRAGLGPLERGLRALRQVLERDQPTSVALPFSMYPGKGVHIVPETAECAEMWAHYGAGAPHIVSAAILTPST